MQAWEALKKAAEKGGEGGESPPTALSVLLAPHRAAPPGHVEAVTSK